MSRRRDYYQVLGVPRDVEDGELKRVYRELARRFHPDLNPDDAAAAERFKEINEAYAVISDKQARARYDRSGLDGDGGGLGSVMDAVEEVLGDVLRRRRGGGSKRGRDLRYTLELTFEEAALGCTKTIVVPEDGAPPVSGTRREFTVAIPPGAKDGAVRTIKGEGEPGRSGGVAGDLNVVVRVQEHPVFRREGWDVATDATVTFPQAALGAVIEVTTLDGPVKMRLPEGTQPGRVFRVRGRGVPRGAGKNAPRGDHLVRVTVAVPATLTTRQRELIEALGREEGGAPERPRRAAAGGGRRGIIDRVRSLLDE